ncbi:acyltransferase family protein [Demequina globuliformis]|uniref:acyltransferase family protein n=1 Tax=Demequina globuliformis TaxID=676202 RepID=UPI00078462EC
MRALALALVVAYHLFGNGRVSGGVDVFLVISAFLLTRSLRRAPTDHPWRAVVRRWAATFSRLTPPALLTIAAVAVTAPWAFAETHLIAIYRQAAATALYVENVELARSQQAYDAASATTSPLQHFWSLSIQGQMFLLLPIVIAGLVVLARGATPRTRHILLVALLAASTIASFLYAMELVDSDQQRAYFSGPARAWELGLGALLALAPSRWMLRGRPAVVTGWLGTVVIVCSGWWIDGAHAYPGPATLVPVVAALAVIAAAAENSRRSLGRVLSVRPVAHVAAVSYGLYLWHWPILIAVMTATATTSIGPGTALVVLAASYLLARASAAIWARPTQWLRQPARRSRQVVPLLAGAALVVALPSGAYAQHLSTERDAELSALAHQTPEATPAPSASGGQDKVPGNPGAAAWGVSGADYSAPLSPSISAANQDLPLDFYNRDCYQRWPDEPRYTDVLVCEDEAAPDNPSHTVVMSGGSHALQWYAAIEPLAREYNWELVIVEKDGCRLQDPGPMFYGSDACRVWNESAEDVIVSQRPDAVVTVGTVTPPEVSRESVLASQALLWGRLVDQGIGVVTIRDNPRFAWDVPTCIATNGVTEADQSACTKETDAALEASSPLTSGAGTINGADIPGGGSRADLTDPEAATTQIDVTDAVTVPDLAASLDLTPWLCDSVTCPVITGNVVMYRDDDHLSATYVRTLTPMVEEQLRAQAAWLFE